MLSSILLQITTTTGAVQDTLAHAASTVAAVAAPVAPKEDSLSLLTLIMKGGYIMIPIGILSVLSIYILIERWIIIRKANKLESNFMLTIKDYVKNGNITAAKAFTKSSSAPVYKMIEKGLNRIDKPIKEVESAIEGVGKLEVAKLEKNLNILGIIAGIAPMFGFIGTISGVIKIFYNISLADNISIGLISGGLYEKMITSAAGLVVGIFAYVGYHILSMMVDSVVAKMETASVEFIDLLQEPAL
ncbi:MAG TPA: MotA/TolQ/ExbB proton channel family protein [Bacteroidia bacterium]|nr:MotA/TolQ/ExbB proton channel family protein [Bacteroidia bacterium]HRH07630.1 MotA/TolQ/ExbB proton channel family protein [Bacteroidia bacterium]HRH64329.1 MotA/TolQ/ExbB proton channel family protein [Bacteroidia bacterium]